jgi:hypothetical protein
MARLEEDKKKSNDVIGSNIFIDADNVLKANMGKQAVTVGYITWNSGTKPTGYLYQDARKALIDKYGDTLWKTIGDTFNLPKEMIGDGTYEAKLIEIINAYSIYNYNRSIASPDGSNSLTVTLPEYLRMLKAGGLTGDGGPKTATSISYTGRQTAWDNFKSATRDLLGMNPSKEEFEKFYKELSQRESKYKTIVTASDTFRKETNEQLNVSDFTIDYIVKNMLESKKDLKGQAGQAQNFIGQLSKSYGLEGRMSITNKTNLIKGMLTGKTKQEDVQDALRRRAKIAYGAFAEDIDKNPDMTLADIMDQYLAVYSDTFEVGGNEISIAEAAKFATGEDGAKRTVWDFQKQLRADKRFGYTKKANEEASNVALSFARAFGVNI